MQYSLVAALLQTHKSVFLLLTYLLGVACYKIIEKIVYILKRFEIKKTNKLTKVFLSETFLN